MLLLRHVLTTGRGRYCWGPPTEYLYTAHASCDAACHPFLAGLPSQGARPAMAASPRWHARPTCALASAGKLKMLHPALRISNVRASAGRGGHPSVSAPTLHPDRPLVRRRWACGHQFRRARAP